MRYQLTYALVPFLRSEEMDTVSTRTMKRQVVLICAIRVLRDQHQVDGVSASLELPPT